MSSHRCSLVGYATLYSEMPVRLPPDTCLTLEGTRSSNFLASACSRRARVPVGAIGTRSGLVASVFPVPRFRQSESTTSEGGSQWCPGVATGMPCSPLTLRAITDSRRPASAKSILQLRRVRGRYYDPLKSDMPYGIYATGRLGFQAEAETTSDRTGTSCPRRNPKCMTVTKTSLRFTTRRWS